MVEAQKKVKMKRLTKSEQVNRQDFSKFTVGIKPHEELNKAAF